MKKPAWNAVQIILVSVLWTVVSVLLDIQYHSFQWALIGGFGFSAIYWVAFSVCITELTKEEKDTEAYQRTVLIKFVIWLRAWMKRPEVNIWFATRDNNKPIRTWPSLEVIVDEYLEDQRRKNEKNGVSSTVADRPETSA